MSIIPEGNKDELKRSLRRELKGDVTLRLFTQRSSLLTIPGRECKSCPQTQELLEELASLSPKLHLEVNDFFSQPEERDRYGVERIPAIVMGADGDSRMKYYGSPLGYEFVTILEDLKLLSRGVSPLSVQSRKNLRRVNQPVHIQVFVTPSCQYCPTVARMAHAICLENTEISADVVEVSEFPNLARMYNVTTVPKTVINQVVQFTGALPEDQFVERVLGVGVRESTQDDATKLRSKR